MGKECMKKNKNRIFLRISLAFLLVVLFSVIFAVVPVNEKRLSAFQAEGLHEALAKLVTEAGEERGLACNVLAIGQDLQILAESYTALGPLGGKAEQVDCTVSLSQKGRMVTAELEGQGQRYTVQKPLIIWTSLLPALIALSVAVFTRRLLAGLFLGVLVGAGLSAMDGTMIAPLSGVTLGTFGVLSGVLMDDFHFWIFLFTFSLIGMVNVATVGGGMAGLAEWFGRLAKGARSTQLATAALGLAVFFDDYSNTVVVGSCMRPLSDRARISREKLAYIVDSTAAPIAGLALISTWIGYEVGLVGDAMDALNLDGSPYTFFLSTLPYRFYCIGTIAFVVINILMRREFGAMRHAQSRAMETGEVLRSGSKPMSGAAMIETSGRSRALNAFLPVLTVILLTLLGMLANGAGLITPSGIHLEAVSSFDTGRLVSLKDNYMVACEDGGFVLAMAAVAGSLLAVMLGWLSGGVSLWTLFKAWLSAWRTLLFAFSVLVMAWSIGDVNGLLGTGAFMVSSLAETVQPWLLPLLIFFLASTISFATGSSWSTMAILLPAAVPLAYHVGGMPLMIISVGAVLDGSIFGDHCSPLSDTTIMSSISAGCDHLDHVRTQLPYAVVVAVIVLACGYSLATIINPLFSYLLAFAAFAGVLRLMGRKA